MPSSCSPSLYAGKTPAWCWVIARCDAGNEIIGPTTREPSHPGRSSCGRRGASVRYARHDARAATAAVHRSAPNGNCMVSAPTPSLATAAAAETMAVMRRPTCAMAGAPPMRPRGMPRRADLGPRATVQCFASSSFSHSPAGTRMPAVPSRAPRTRSRGRRAAATRQGGEEARRLRASSPARRRGDAAPRPSSAPDARRAGCRRRRDATAAAAEPPAETAAADGRAAAARRREPTRGGGAASRARAAAACHSPSPPSTRRPPTRRSRTRCSLRRAWPSTRRARRSRPPLSALRTPLDPKCV